MSALIRRAAVCALLVLPVCATSASALPVFTGPPEGSLVGARPQFSLSGDLTEVVSASVEVSKDPALKTAGEEAGAFLERFEWSVWSVPEDLTDGLLTWTADDPLPAGRYYWHGHLNSGMRPSLFLQPGVSSYGPVGSFEVADQPALVEGWVVRAKRLKSRKGCNRVQFTATVAHSDLEDDPVAITVTLKQGSKLVLRMANQDASYSPSKLTGIGCSRASSVTATLAVKDAQNITRPPAQRVKITR